MSIADRQLRLRLMIRMYCELGCTLRDIGGLFGITAGAVGNNLRRAGVVRRHPGERAWQTSRRIANIRWMRGRSGGVS